MFFIIPCVDIYEKIDLRVRNFNVPPQEVNFFVILDNILNLKSFKLNVFTKVLCFKFVTKILEIYIRNIIKDFVKML